MTTDLANLDRIALRAWPAAEEHRLGEWLLRLDAGYTKRANAAYVLGREPHLDLEARLAACAAIYKRHGLPLIVRESSLVDDSTLAAWLAASGFSRFDETIVMTRTGLPAEPAAPRQIDLDEWLALYASIEGATKGNQRHHREIISRVATPVCPAARYAGGEPVAIGLAVADGRWVGMFDIATDSGHRRQGHGQALVEDLLGWGAGQGADRAYLQVLGTNSGAIALYEGLGFGEAYRYWYWGRRGK